MKSKIVSAAFALAFSAFVLSTNALAQSCPSQNETQLLMTLTGAYSSLLQAEGGLPLTSVAYEDVAAAAGYVETAETELNTPSTALKALTNAGNSIRAALKLAPPVPVQNALGNGSNLISATVIGLQQDLGVNGAVTDIGVADQLILQYGGNTVTAPIVKSINTALVTAQTNISNPNVLQELADALDQIPALSAVVPPGSQANIDKAATYISNAVKHIQAE